MTTTRYPFDFSTFQLGTTLSKVEIQKTFPQLVPETNAWNLKVLELRGLIEKDFKQRIPPRSPVIVNHEGGLKVCTDSEAAGAVRDRARLEAKRQRKNFRSIVDVDRAKLSAEQITKLDDLQIRESRKIVAAKEIDKSIRLETRERPTPTRKLP